MKNTLLKKQAWAVCLVVRLATMAYGWDGAVDQESWEDMRAQVESKKTELETLYTQAENAELDVERAYVSILTIEQFLDVTQWDYTNTTAIATYMDSWPLNKYYDTGDEAGLAFDELQDCLEVAEYAIEQLNQQLSGEIELAPSIDLFAAHKVVDGANFVMNGRPVFISNAGIPGGADARRAFGGHGSGHHYLNHLESDLTAKYWPRKNAIDGVSEDNPDFFTPITHFHGHTGTLPSWMTEGSYDVNLASSSPSIYEGGRNFVNYDISNPYIQSWLGSLNEDMVSGLAQANADSDGVPMVHILANEPHFDCKLGGWCVSKGGFTSYMTDGFLSWLEEKYGTIAALNARHGTSYTGFDDYPINLPLDASEIQGTPEYYEYVSYNLDRVNDFFDLMNTVVKTNDPTALAHIKLLGGTLLSGMSGGIDFEYLTALMDVTGSDYEVVPDTATFFNNEPDRTASDSWLANYSFYWTVGLQSLDYAKSINPDAPYFNSEYHGFSTGSWRDFEMKRDYVRASLWLSFTHGLNMIDPWWWGRDSDGSIDSSATIGSLGTLPVAVDELGRTSKEVNAHAETIAALADQDRFAYVYWSRPATIQSSSTHSSGEQIYEALKLLNYAVGMTSVSRIETLDPSHDFVVVPPMPYLPDDELDALLIFQAAGGRIIVFEEADEPFASMDELGFARTNSDFTPNHILTSLGDPFTMAGDLSAITADMVPERTIPFEIETESGISSYSVLIQEANDVVAGCTDLFLINVSKETKVVDLGVDTTTLEYTYTDLLTGQSVEDVRSLQIDSMEVRLLRAVRNSEATATKHAWIKNISDEFTTVTGSNMLTGNIYTLQKRPSLKTGSWTDIISTTGVTQVDWVGLPATNSMMFYRIQQE